MAKEHEKARELERVQRYHMPLEKGKSQPEPEYVDNEPPQSEQSKWESDQMSFAQFKFGARDKKGKFIFYIYINLLIKKKKITFCS